MGTVKVPETYKHICDICRNYEGTDSPSRPKYWADLTFAVDAYDYQGCAVADGTSRWMMCPSCAKAIEEAIDLKMAELKKKPL